MHTDQERSGNGRNTGSEGVLRLALRVLSRRCKDKGIPAEDDLDGWPKTIERRSLDEFLQDQSTVGYGVISTEQFVAQVDLWQFLQDHLPREKRMVPFVDKQFCDVLIEKLLNHSSSVVDLALGIVGRAIYLQWTRFQPVCGMEAPDFEIYSDSNVTTCVIRSLKLNPKQFETLLMESTRPLTCVELTNSFQFENPWTRSFLQNCPCAFCNDKVRIQFAIYGIWKECNKCRNPLVVIPKDLRGKEAAQVDKSFVSDTEANCLICKRTVRIEKISPEALLAVNRLFIRQWELRSALHPSNITVCRAAFGLSISNSHLLHSHENTMLVERYERVADDLTTRFKKFGWRSLVLSDMYRAVATAYCEERNRMKYLKVINKSKELLAELVPGDHVAFDWFRM